MERYAPRFAFQGSGEFDPSKLPDLPDGLVIAAMQREDGQWVKYEDALAHGEQRYRDALDGFAGWIEAVCEKGVWPEESDPVCIRAGLRRGDPVTFNAVARLARAFAEENPK